MLKQKSINRVCVVSLLGLSSLSVLAETPKLNIKTKHGFPMEEQRKAQMERLAKQYDLKKYTITRDIVIERGAMNHSYPVLTLNLRFLDNDDLALSAYVHEQGHWVLMERHRADNPRLFEDLHNTFPNLEIQPPGGDGELRSSYFHIAVCMLEWQAMEELVGAERARKVIEWKQGHHYTGIYSTMLNQRPQVEAVLNRYDVRW
jgi:hypothetical protein